MTAANTPATPEDGLDGQLIGIIGGTGPQGRGLASRFAASGLKVIIGSRTAERGAATAAEMDVNVDGDSNEGTARRADVVLLTVPWEGHEGELIKLEPALRGKIVVDCVNPLGFDRHGPYRLEVPEGSAAEQAQALLPRSTVVAAFHHLSAVTLLDPEVASIDADVLVLGEDREATDRVAALASRIAGCRGIYAGPLRNAGQVEAFTANLIAMNRRYRAHASVRITDV